MKCFICEKLLEDSTEIEDHFLSHDLNDVQRLQCHLCNLSFLKFSTLEKHLKRVHIKRKLSTHVENSYELSALRREVEIFYEKSRNENRRLIADDDDHQGKEDFGAEPDTDSQHGEKKQKMFMCSVDGCSKTFKHLTSFIMHGKCVHSEDRPFTCETCSKSFKTSSNLNVHIKMHNNQRDHQCTDCPQAFFTSSHLKAHLKIHLNEMKYKCELEGCGKSFIHLSSFKKHQNFHQGIKGHRCKVCNRDFSQSCHLRAHLKIHTNERNHICDKCSKAFRRPDTLRIHQRTHES